MNWCLDSQDSPCEVSSGSSFHPASPTHSLPIFDPMSKLLVPGHSACEAKCEIKGQVTATHEMDVAQGTHEHSVLLGKNDLTLHRQQLPRLVRWSSYGHCLHPLNANLQLYKSTWHLQSSPRSTALETIWSVCRSRSQVLKELHDTGLGEEFGILIALQVVSLEHERFPPWGAHMQNMT